MRVLIVTSEFHPHAGGIERYVADMARSLASQVDVGLIMGAEQFPPPGSRYATVGRLNLASVSNPGALETATAQLVRQASDFRPDVIHLASAGLAVFAPTLTSIAPVFATVHGKDLTRPRQQTPGQDVAALIALGLAVCQRVFCVSRSTEGQVLDRCRQARTCVLTPGLTPTIHLHPAPILAEADRTDDRRRRIRLVTAGRIIRRKGHRRLLTILEHLRTPVTWTIIGAGPGVDVLKERVRDSPLRRHIHLAGVLDDKAMWRAMAQADLFALTPVDLVDDAGLDAEGFGMVFVEAGAVGTPAIGSIYGGCGEAVRNGETGLLIDPLDPARAAVALDALLVDPARLKRMGDAACAFAMNNHGWGDRVNTLLAAYRDAWNAKPLQAEARPAAPYRSATGCKPRAAVLIPVGPACRPAFVRDTLESAAFWLGKDVPIVVLDNSGTGMGPCAAADMPAVDILTFPAACGVHGKLFVMLAQGLARILDRYDPEVVVRMDTDALVVGPDLIERAQARFAADPGLAGLGAWRISATGAPRDFTTAAKALAHATARTDESGLLVAGAVRMALAHDYTPGEHLLGGGCLLHRRGLDALEAMGVLEQPCLAALNVGEDVLFSLFIRAAGLTLGEFARAGEPLGCKWRGLPADPPTLQAQGRALVHSVRHFGRGWDEARIRAWFRAERDMQAWTGVSRRAG